MAPHDYSEIADRYGRIYRVRLLHHYSGWTSQAALPSTMIDNRIGSAARQFSDRAARAYVLPWGISRILHTEWGTISAQFASLAASVLLGVPFSTLCTNASCTALGECPAAAVIAILALRHALAA